MKKVSGFLAASGEAKGWKDIPEAGLIIEPGNSEQYYTGGWRTFMPLVDKKRCINCMRCWIICPDAAIYAENQEMQGFDMDHCKGCGLCAKICPTKCIKMVKETEFESMKKDFDERGRTTTLTINEKK